MNWRRLPAALVLALLAACESSNQPPAPSPGPGPGGGETISGSERIGWDQQAASQAELSTFRYAIYVDNARSEVASVTCAATAGTSGFPCSGRLPSMSPGAHTLELAAFVESNGIIESARSAPLRVTVTGATTPAADPSLTPGEIVTTREGVRLTTALIVDGLSDVVDLTLAPAGTLLIAERSLGVVFADAGAAAPPFRAATDAPLLAVTAAPDFLRSGHVFAIEQRGAAASLLRYRLYDTQLIERMHVIPDVAAARDPSAALRFGPDGKLYAAFDSGGNVDASQRLSDWRGKILRLEPDGSTPDDQPAASPVYWHGLASPRSMAWPTAGPLWLAERGHDGIERLRAIGASGSRPRRTGMRASYALPGGVGAASLAFHPGTGVPTFAGNLFIAARAGYLLRVQFDESNASQAMRSEKLLEGKVAELRAVAVAPDGAIYVATPTSVWRLAVAR